MHTQNHTVGGRYYSLRRLSPFQDTLRVVDVESAMAYSSDGRHWQVRRRNRLGYFRTVGVWSERARDVIGRCRDAEVLNAALRSRPPLPFPQYNPSPNDSPCLAAVAARISDFERYYECIAHPFEWKYTGTDLNALLAKMRTHHGESRFSKGVS